MADGRPYADLADRQRWPGCYGPASKDGDRHRRLHARTSRGPRSAARNIVDHRRRRHLGGDAAGRRGSRAVDAAEQGGAGGRIREAWMRVEAVRQALFDSGQAPPTASQTGRCRPRRAARPTRRSARHAGRRRRTSQDARGLARRFPILRVLTGLGIAPAPPRTPAHARARGAADQPAVARGRTAAGGIRPSRRQGRARPPIVLSRSRDPRGTAATIRTASDALKQQLREHSSPPEGPAPPKAKAAEEPPAICRRRAIAAHRRRAARTAGAPAPGLCPRSSAEHRHRVLRNSTRSTLAVLLGEDLQAGPGRRVSRGRRRRPGRAAASTSRSTSIDPEPAGAGRPARRRRATRSSTSRWSTPSP